MDMLFMVRIALRQTTWYEIPKTNSDEVPLSYLKLVPKKINILLYPFLIQIT